MSQILRFRNFNLDAPGRVLLNVGQPMAVPLLSGVLTAFVDRDAVSGDRTHRFELFICGATVSAFGLTAGFKSQLLAAGWAISHNANGLDAAGDIAVIDIEIH